MALEKILTEIIARLRQGRYQNEQAISQGIVLPILHDKDDMHWDTLDTAIVWPEYQTGQGRVDFALCHPASKPIIFIEVKQPGKAEDAVRQALEYAFHTGVQFVVLTDGRTWSFYLPSERGSYEDRRVYKLDLFERPLSEAKETLCRYLSYLPVTKGEAIETARKEYRIRTGEKEARAAIPEVWRELVEKGDELLVELLASAVESKAGRRPKVDDVAEFLAALGKPVIVEASRSNVSQPISSMDQRQRIDGESSRRVQLVLRGKAHACKNAKEAMVFVLCELAKGDPSFLERCSQHPDAQGSKRHYIARTPEELYPDREDLRDMRETLPGGWLVATNLNNVLKKTIIKLAAEVAGLTFGKDVFVEF